MVTIRDLIIIAVFCFAPAIALKGQADIHNNKKENVMKIIYEQKIDSLSILLEYSEKNNSPQWETKLVNHKTKKEISVLLDKKEKNTLSYPSDSSINIFKDNFVQLYLILGAYIHEKTLYVVYEKWGVVSLYSFQFTASEVFTSDHRELTGHFVTQAYGPLTSNAAFKEIKSSIYLLLNMGQSANTESSSEFYRISDIHTINKLSFSESSTQMIATYGLSTNGRNFLANVIDEDQLSDNEDYHYLKQFSERPYYLKKLSLDENKRVHELYEIEINGLSLYDIYDSTPDIPDNKDNEEIIKEILSFCNANTNIKYLDCLVDGRNSVFYFFYLDSDNHIQIMGYKKKYCIWEIYKCVKFSK